MRAKIGSGLLQIPSAAAIIRDSQGRILLVKSAEADVWGLPAGAIDPGETPEAAVVREVFEETNLRVEPLKIAGVFGGKDFRYRYPNGDAVEYFIVVFECAVIGGTIKSRDGEVSEFRFYASEEMPELAIPYPKELFRK